MYMKWRHRKTPSFNCKEEKCCCTCTFRIAWHKLDTNMSDINNIVYTNIEVDLWSERNEIRKLMNPEIFSYYEICGKQKYLLEN